MLQNIQGTQPQPGMQGMGMQNFQQQRPQATWYGGRPEFTEQTPLLTGQQQGLQNNAIQQLMQLLNGTGGLQGFQPIEDRAREQFATQTIPGLAERFTSLGTQRSGAYKNALNSQGREFELGLGQLKSQYGLGQQGLLSQLGTQQSFQNNHFARQPGLPENFLNQIAPLIPFLPMLLGFGGGGIPKGNNNQQQPSSQPVNQGNIANSYGLNTKLNFGQSPQLGFGGL